MTDEQRRRRLVAAREFRGYTQARFADLMHDYGLGKKEAPRVERGELAWRSVHTGAFSEVLRVPPTWFTDPDDDRVIGYSPGAAASVDAAKAVAGAASATPAPPRDTGEQQQPKRSARNG